MGVTIRIMLLLLLSKVIGFIRSVVIVFYFGAGTISDVYITVTNVPLQIVDFLSAGLIFVLIPLYTRTKAEQGIDEANLLVKKVMMVLLKITSTIVLLVMIAPTPVIKLFAAGYTGEKLAMTSDFLRISIWGVFFIVLSTILSSYAQAERKFYTTSTLAMVSNVVMIGSIIVSVVTPIGLIALPVGFIMSKVAETGVMIPIVRQNGFRFGYVKTKLNDPMIRSIILLMLPVFVGSSADQINLWIDRSIASTISNGAVSILTYAAMMKNLFEGVVITALTMITFPQFSTLSVENNMAGIKNALRKSINVVTFLMIPVAVATAMLAPRLVQGIFMHGAYSTDDSNATAAALSFYSIGLLGSGFRALLSRVFYALGDTKTPMKNAVVAVIFNIILNFLLAPIFGISGLALASSLSIILCSLLLLNSLRKKIGFLHLRSVAIEGIKSIVVSLAVAAWILAFYHLGGDKLNLLIGLFLCTISGVGVLLGSAFALKIEALTALFKRKA